MRGSEAESHVLEFVTGQGCAGVWKRRLDGATRLRLTPFPLDCFTTTS
jgi:hypothetical protein